MKSSAERFARSTADKPSDGFLRVGGSEGIMAWLRSLSLTGTEGGFGRLDVTGGGGGGIECGGEMSVTSEACEAK